MSKPKISVIVSLYQPEDFIEDFLKRIATQTAIDDAEFIFLINEDDLGYTTNLVNKFECKFKQIVEIGVVEPLYVSWNRAIGLSNGDYLTNFNVDDYHLPENLRIHAEVLDTYPMYGLSYGKCEYTNSPIPYENFVNYSNKIRSQVVSFIEEKNHRIVGCSPMWRKSLHDAFGMFDTEKFKGAADHDMWIRFMKGGVRFGAVNITTVIQHLHENTLTSRVNPNNVENELLAEVHGREYI